MNLSRREKRLLYLLLIVALLASFMLAFKYFSDKKDSFDSELVSVQEETMKIKNAVKNLLPLESSIPNLKSEALSMKDSMYDVLKNREIDRYITELAVACKLKPVSLSINGAQLLPINTYSLSGISENDSEMGTETAVVKTASLIFSATGNLDSFYYFVDAINDRDGLRISAFNLTAPIVGDNYNMTFSLNMFMSDVSEETFNVVESVA
ncbi:MAG: hypothetical protein RR933_02100 [Oscillospiraceae bacterium]